MSTVFLTTIAACEWRTDPNAEPETKSESNHIMIDHFIHSPFLYPESNPEPVISYSNREFKCLADNIYHEARGEGDLGMRLVGDVTVNRALSDRFPDDICRVVYQPSQFSWTRFKKSITERSAYRKAERIAKQTLHRERDRSYGALYFFGHRVTTPAWSWYKNVTIKHKNHTFMK